MGLFDFLGKAIGFLIWFIQHVFPWVMKVVGAALTAMGVALIGIGKGVWENSNDLADHWTTDFYKNNPEFPTRYDYIIRDIFFVVAIFTHVIGWVILSYLTVWIVGMIF